MKAFFDMHTSAAVAFRLTGLQEEARSWIATPFVAHSCVKGAGVDCVHLAAAIYKATGVLDRFDPPAYALDGGQHNQISQVVTWLDNHPRFIVVYHRNGIEDWQPMPGDALCFRFGLSEHHVGVMLFEKQFIHAANRRKVVVSSLTDPIYRRALSAVYRPVEGGAA